MSVTSETIVYNGRSYVRYPESPYPALQKYFLTTPRINPETGERWPALHRQVWIDHNGPIPRGHHVHHTDRNTSNNDISNLECIPRTAHKHRHGGYCSDRHRAQLDRIRPLSSAWTKTPAGRQLVGERTKRLWETRPRDAYTLTCQVCGTEYPSAFPARGENSFCSAKCSNFWYHKTKRYHEERICVMCGSAFSVDKWQKTKTCSRTCAGAMRRTTSPR